MSEHLIRLRGAWQWRRRDEPADASRRIDLPTCWEDRPEGPIRLTRRFQRPRLDPDRERLVLRLADVPGLRSVNLNGQEITPDLSRPVSEVLELPIDDLLRPSNELTLEVDLRDLPSSDVLAWGSVALVVRPDFR